MISPMVQQLLSESVIELVSCAFVVSSFNTASPCHLNMSLAFYFGGLGRCGIAKRTVEFFTLCEGPD